jgi:hypothetical protein
MDDNLSKELDVMIGVFQEVVFIPFLFVIMTNYVMNNAWSVSTSEKSDHDFIDNLCLFYQPPYTIFTSPTT